MFDLERFVRVSAEGLDWKKLQQKDIRMDDYHITSVWADMFKDPRFIGAQGLVQFNFFYVLEYSDLFLTQKHDSYAPCREPICKSSHARLDFIVHDKSKNAGIVLGTLDFTMSSG